MANGYSPEWHTITSDEAYRLKSAEFQGMTIQALKDIQKDIQDLQNDANVTRYIAMIIGGLSGVITSGLLSLGFKPPTHG